jgi:hypothetical protein
MSTSTIESPAELAQTELVQAELVQFITDMAQDPYRVAAFTSDPGTFLAGSGLSAANQDLLLSSTEATLRVATMTSESPDNLPVVIIIVLIV